VSLDGTQGVRFGVALQGVDPPDEFTQLVLDIEKWGFDQLWLTDSSLHARDVYSYLTLAATVTAKLSIGTSVTNPATRHPAMNALAIATIDEISGGRAALGIGAGDRPLLSLGLHPAKVSELRDTVEASRRLFRGESVTMSSSAFSLKDARLHFAARAGIPIYLSASGPRILELAGEVADGVIVLAGLFPEAIAYALSHIRAGAERAHRPAPVVTTFMYGSLREDEELAVTEARSIAAWFCQTAPHYCNLGGMPEETCRRVRAAYQGGEFQEAAAASRFIAGEVVKKVALAGSPEYGRQKVQMLIDAGVRSIVIFPLGPDRRQVIETFAHEVMPFFTHEQTVVPH